MEAQCPIIPSPPYFQSTSAGVDSSIRRAVPDESFIRKVPEEEKRRGDSLSVWALIILSLLKKHRRLTMPQLHEFSRLEERRAAGAVEDLVESGVVEASGSSISRPYILSFQGIQSGQRITGVCRAEYYFSDPSARIGT